ncbi:MAG: hypothetical protein ACE5KF_11940 [Kiloniellaceae bacterium]
MRLSSFDRLAGRPSATWAEDDARRRAGGRRRNRLQVGQRYYRAGFPAVIWSVVAVYRDAQGVEHAILADEARRLENKTLSVAVLLDRSRYRLI